MSAEVLQLVTPRAAYSRNRETVRPFRLWEAAERKNIPHRFYADKRRAHMGALIEARWSAVGRTIEVYDCRNGKLLGQYTRRIDHIAFLEG